jgi:hypothetical protein
MDYTCLFSKQSDLSLATELKIPDHPIESPRHGPENILPCTYNEQDIPWKQNQTIIPHRQFVL